MPVTVLLIVLVVLFVGLLYAADRVVQAIKRGRRRTEANRRLAAAAARAEAQAEARDRQRRAAAEASTALTSVLPAIHDHAPRHVD